MAIEINGTGQKAASAGQGALATTLGAIGVGLGVLNGGGILNNGLLGGNTNGNQNEPSVGMQKYYEDRIADIKEMNAQFAGVNEAICALRERASISETTNHWQSEMTRVGFAHSDSQLANLAGYVDRRFQTEAVIDEKNLQLALCNVVKATPMITPNQIGMNFINPTYVLESHEARPYREGNNHGSGCSPCYGGF